MARKSTTRGGRAPATPSRSVAGHALTGALIVAALAGVGVVAVSGLPGRGAPAAAAAAAAPTAGELRALAAEIGLSPEALAAAGLSGQQAASGLAALRTHMEESAAALRQAELEHSLLLARHDHLARRVRSRVAGEQEQTEFAQVQSALAGARSQRQSIRDAAFSAAADAAGITAEQRQTLARLLANRHREAPTPYRVAERTELEWVRLRDALAHQQIAARTGDEVDAAARTIVLSADAEPAVALAAANLAANLVAVRAAWDAALSEPE